MDGPVTHRSLRLGTPPRYIVRNRDRVYGEFFTRRLRAMGIRDRPTAPRSPWQNGHTERLIGSIRRECLDHVVVFGERHLRHILRFDKLSCQEQRVRDAKWQAHCREGHREEYQVNARHVHYSLVYCTGCFWLSLP